MSETLFAELDAQLTPASLWSRLAPKAPAYPCLIRARYDLTRRPRSEVAVIVVDGSDRVDRGTPIDGHQAIERWLDDLRACGLHVAHLEATRALASPRSGRAPLSQAAIDELRAIVRALLEAVGVRIPSDGTECIVRLWRTNRGPRIELAGGAGAAGWTEALYADVQPAAGAWLNRHVGALAGVQRLGAVMTLPAV